jgi:prolyl-tRNA synthetase
VRVILDDRVGMSAGVKFTDAELLGMPTIVVVGRGLVQGLVELRDRRTGSREDVAIDEIVSRVVDLYGRT